MGMAWRGRNGYPTGSGTVVPSATAFVTIPPCFGFFLVLESVDGSKSVRVKAIAHFFSHFLSSHVTLCSYLALSSHLILSDRVSAHPHIVPYRALRPISINQSFPFLRNSTWLPHLAPSFRVNFRFRSVGENLPRARS